MTPQADWSERKALVTGASGLVGSWLVRDLLERDADVVAFVLDTDPRSPLFSEGISTRCTVVNGDLTCYEDIERAINLHETDTVFHLGAQTLVGAAHRSPLPTFEANIRGSYNLLEACRRLDTVVERVVVASSDKAYGPHDNLPYTEDHALQGAHPYEVSKSCTDLLTASYHHTYRTPTTIARCGNIYGGGDLNWSRIVPGAIRAFLEGRRPQIRSDGSPIRDYVYVEDITAAYVRSAEAVTDGTARGEAFNFSDEEPVSVLEMMRRIADVMGIDTIEPEILGTAQGELDAQYLDSSKARDRLDWRPQVGVDEGIRRTVAWYARYLGRQAPLVEPSR